MAGIPFTSDIGYRRTQTLQRGVPVEERAIPDVETPAYGRGLGVGEAATEAAKLEKTISTANLLTEETKREHEAILATARDRLEQAGKMNKVASILGLGGTAVTAMGGLAMMGEAERRQEQNQALIGMLKEATLARRIGEERVGADQREFYARILEELKRPKVPMGAMSSSAGYFSENP